MNSSSFCLLKGKYTTLGAASSKPMNRHAEEMRNTNREAKIAIGAPVRARNSYKTPKTSKWVVTALPGTQLYAASPQPTTLPAIVGEGGVLILDSRWRDQYYGKFVPKKVEIMRITRSILSYWVEAGGLKLEMRVSNSDSVRLGDTPLSSVCRVCGGVDTRANTTQRGYYEDGLFVCYDCMQPVCSVRWALDAYNGKPITCKKCKQEFVNPLEIRMGYGFMEYMNTRSFVCYNCKEKRSPHD
jgi:hypothetical protein